jgi:hypothetical protein
MFTLTHITLQTCGRPARTSLRYMQRIPKQKDFIIETILSSTSETRSGIFQKLVHTKQQWKTSEKQQVMADQPNATDEYLRVLTNEEWGASITCFIDCTGNEALWQEICVVCAQEVFVSMLLKTMIDAIPNKHLLHPSQSHPAYQLYDGALLHPQAVVPSGDGHIYHECNNKLQNDALSSFALANNMWIGDIPFELGLLTLPERLLVSKYFPVAYIVKLFPKDRGAFHWDPTKLQNGIRGNVSTYPLDPQEIANLVHDNIMPRPAILLPSVMGVTFVGPRGLPEKTMVGTFRVRRNRIRDALQWMKSNNPLFSDIVISNERLQSLPENGIPREITLAMKYSDDIQHLNREHAGYGAPAANDGDEGSVPLLSQRDVNVEPILDVQGGINYELGVSADGKY